MQVLSESAPLTAVKNAPDGHADVFEVHAVSALVPTLKPPIAQFVQVLSPVAPLSAVKNDPEGHAVFFVVQLLYESADG